MFEKEPICPICGKECSEIHVQDGYVIGCDRCVDTLDVWDWLDMEEDDDEAIKGDMEFERMREMRFE